MSSDTTWNGSLGQNAAQWRDRAVIISAILLFGACIQCVVTAGALPFVVAEPLHVAVAVGWSNPLAWIDDSLLWTELGFGLAGAAMIAVYAASKHWMLRWAAILGAILIGAPGLLFRWSPERFIRRTYEVLTEPKDGESWEFMAFIVAGWWLGLWLISGVLEIVLPARSVKSSVRGFEVEVPPTPRAFNSTGDIKNGQSASDDPERTAVR